MFTFPAVCQTQLILSLSDINRPGRQWEYLVLGGFVCLLCGCLFDSTLTNREELCVCASVRSCGWTSVMEVYFYTWICFDVTRRAQMKTSSPPVTHTTLKAIYIVMHTHTHYPECDHHVLAPSSETITDDKIQHGCSASLGCMGVHCQWELSFNML